MPVRQKESLFILVLPCFPENTGARSCQADDRSAGARKNVPLFQNPIYPAPPLTPRRVDYILIEAFEAGISTLFLLRSLSAPD